MGCEPGYAHGISHCSPQQVWNDITHDSDINAASRKACIGRIGQQSNGGCGNSHESTRSLMPRAVSLLRASTHPEREPDLEALDAARRGELDWILGETG